MARIRTIKPETATSEQIAACSPVARLMFILMWNFCDDNGVHPASIMRLKMEVFPADSFSKEYIQELIDELICQNLIEHYEVNGHKYWLVTGWHKHQRIDQPNYKYPLKNGEIPSNPMNRRIKNASANEVSTNELRMNAERTHPDMDMDRNGEDKTLSVEVKNTSTLVDEVKEKIENKSIIDNCPHQEIIDLYHEILPMCRVVKIWNDKRRSNLRSRWRESKKHQTIEFWRNLFMHVKKSDWLTGKVPPSRDRPQFVASLEFLVSANNFAKVVEGFYHKQRNGQ